MPIDIYDDNLFRKDFPFFESENGEYVYFNSAATALKPRCVIDAVCDYYSNYSANVDRGVDSLGYKVTKMYNPTICEELGISVPDDYTAIETE